MTFPEWLEHYQIRVLHDDSTAPDESFQVISVVDDTILYCCDRSTLEGDTAYDNAIELARLGKDGKLNLRDYFGPACWWDFVHLNPIVAR